MVMITMIDVFQILFILDQLAFDFYFATSPGELQGIWLQIEKHLLDSLLVTANYELVFKTNEWSLEIYSNELCLYLLDLNDFFNSLFYIKLVTIFPEFALL